MTSKISIIVAMDEKRGIGKNNSLLFKIPADMQRMKTLTNRHPLVMGRKTFESLGRLLPNRTHIVITGNPQNLKKLNYQPQFIVSSLKEGIEVAKKCSGSNEIFIFGGVRVYSEAIEKDLVDKLYMTLVKGEYGAEVFFPEYRGFKTVKKEVRSEGEYNFTFLELEK